jgi:hypothetical protein
MEQERPKRGRKSQAYGLLDLHNHYKKSYHNPVDKKTYKNVLKDFFEMRVDAIILDDLPFVMPKGIGEIRVEQKKILIIKNSKKEVRVINSKLDFVATKAARKALREKMGDEAYEAMPQKDLPRVFFLNMHSNMYKYDVKWYKPPRASSIRNISVYTFKFTRANNRRFAAHCKDPKKHLSFLEVSPYEGRTPEMAKKIGAFRRRDARMKHEARINYYKKRKESYDKR